ncbi:MAG: lipopolysaccharide exporter [Bacteroidia bacterium]|jgi:lipopolysaccharide exporter
MQRTFLHNVFKMMGGSFVGQLIPFLTLPILTRFYEPDDFGTLTIFVTIYTLIGAVSTLKLEFALVGIKDESEARLTVKLIFRILIVVAVVVSIVTSTSWAANNFNMIAELGWAAYLLGPAVLVFGMLETFNYWFNRVGSYGRLASYRIVQNAAAEGGKFGLAFSALQSVGLPLGRFMGEVVTTISHSWKFIKSAEPGLQPSALKPKDLLVKHKKFPLFSTPSVLLGKLVLFVQVSLFLHFFGKEVVGHIGVVMSFMGAALAMVSRSFSQVFFKHISDIKDVASIRKEYFKNLRILILIGASVIGVSWIVPASWVTMLLGPKWDVLMPFARVMSIWLAISFVSAAQSFIYIRMGKQKVMMFFDALHVLMVIASIYIGFEVTGTAIGTTWSYTIAQACFYIFTTVYAIRIIKEPT